MSVELFEQFCEENNLEIKVFQEKGDTHTAEASAKSYGISVNRIVKSLLLKVDGEFIMFLVPGDKRLDFEGVKEKLGAKKVRMASVDEVKERTGHSIGGVPPFGHLKKLKTYIEDGFSGDEYLLAAAGKDDAVFKIGLKELREITKK